VGHSSPEMVVVVVDEVVVVDVVEVDDVGI